MKKKLSLLVSLIIAASTTLSASASGYVPYTPVSTVDLDFAEHPDVKVHFEDFVTIDKILQDSTIAYNAGYTAGKNKSGGVNWEYARHYHKDADGNHVAAESHYAQGGCFNTPVYHTHSRAKGCYHVVSCESTSWHTESRTYDNGDVRTNWVCDGCGRTGAMTGLQVNGANNYSWTVDSPKPGRCGNELSVTLICTKSTANPGGYIDYWVPNCGYTDGEIFGVNITSQGIDDIKNIVKKDDYIDTLRFRLASIGQMDFGGGNVFDSVDFDNVIARFAEHVELDYTRGYAVGLKDGVKSSIPKATYVYIDGVLYDE